MDIELTKETMDHISDRHLEGGESENRFCNTFLYRNGGLKSVAQYVIDHGDWAEGGDNRFVYYFNYNNVTGYEERDSEIYLKLKGVRIVGQFMGNKFWVETMYPRGYL